MFLFRKNGNFVYITKGRGENGGKWKTAWGQGFFTVSTEFSTASFENSGYAGGRCGKKRGKEGAKKNFLA